MLKSLNIKNLTVFPEANLHFSRHLNVIVGENGTGKTHLLKMAYSALATSWEEGRKPTSSLPTKTLMQTRLNYNLTINSSILLLALPLIAKQKLY